MAIRLAGVEVREDSRSTPDNPLWRAVVTTKKGYCFTSVYAGDKPETDKVAVDFKTDWKTTGMKNWDPYCC